MALSEHCPMAHDSLELETRRFDANYTDRVNE